MPTITDADVCLARYVALRPTWDVIRVTEGLYRLPDCLLWAVGWRETRLQMITGDGGHGHGVFQLDDRNHVIPEGFDRNLGRQAVAAAVILRGNLAHYQGNLGDALSAYNAGVGSIDSALLQRQDPDTRTTGGNYGRDVIAHMTFLHAHHIALRIKEGEPGGQH